MEETIVAPSKRMKYSWWLGFATHALISLCIQDYYGLEGYIEMVQNNWMNIHWTVWIPFIVFCFVWSVIIATKADDTYRPRYNGES